MNHLEKRIRKRAFRSCIAAAFMIGIITSVVILLVILFFDMVVDTSSAKELRTVDLAGLIIYGITRLSAAFIGIFLIQILVVMSRYLFRISFHLYACADAIEFFSKEPEKVPLFVDALLPKHIDFGGSPETLADKALDSVCEILKKFLSSKIS